MDVVGRSVDGIGMDGTEETVGWNEWVAGETITVTTAVEGVGRLVDMVQVGDPSSLDWTWNELKC